jgi:hypothetical protein
MKNDLATLSYMSIVAETVLITLFLDYMVARIFFTISSLTVSSISLNKTPPLCFMQSQLYFHLQGKCRGHFGNTYIDLAVDSVFPEAEVIY